MATFEPRTREEWRQWLTDNAAQAGEVWLVLHRTASARPSIPHDDAVADALCFGWIDSKSVTRDEHSRYQRFAPRNPRSTWSKANRERAQRLVDAGLMTPAGQAAVDHAKRTGTWDRLADAQNLVVPADLQRHLDADEAALRNFGAFPPSSRRAILEWIATARRRETRDRRITETVRLAARNVRANDPAGRQSAGKGHPSAGWNSSTTLPDGSTSRIC